MAKFSSKDVGFALLGPYSILGAISKFDDAVTLKLNETYALGETDESYWSSGAKNTEITQEGWYDDAVGQLHQAFVGTSSLPILGLPLSIAPHGNTNAARIDTYPSVQRVGYTVQMATSEVTKAQARYGLWYGKRETYVVHALGTETTAGSTDPLDVHPYVTNTSNGGAVVLHVTALSGCATCTITVRHSTDGITWADKQAFQALAPSDVTNGTALAGQYITLTSTMNQYWSVAWTYGTPATPNVTFMVGVYRAP